MTECAHARLMTGSWVQETVDGLWLINETKTKTTLQTELVATVEATDLWPCARNNSCMSLVCLSRLVHDIHDSSEANVLPSEHQMATFH